MKTVREYNNDMAFSLFFWADSSINIYSCIVTLEGNCYIAIY